MRMSAVYALILLVPLRLEVAGQGSARLVPPATDAVLRPGDALRIAVWRQPELSGEFLVAEDGTLLHPIYRDIHVAGVPIANVHGEIAALLGRFESTPQFVIEPLLRVVVTGEVRQPGLYSLPPGTPLAQAIVAAGGITPQAKMNSLVLLRAGEARGVKIDGSAESRVDLTIQSGDQIVVGRRSSVFRDYFWPAASIIGAVASLIRLAGRT